MTADAGGLSPTEFRVMAFVAAGLMNKQIAHEIGIGEATVKAHVSSIMRKLDAPCRGSLILRHHGIDYEGALADARALSAGRVNRTRRP